MPFALTPALVPSRASRRARATCGGATSTPRSLSTSSVAGEREPAPAHPLGLLRVQNSFVVSAPRWIQPSEQGVEIGALATGEGDITDVGDDVSARHAHIWCDAQNIWHVEDLSSTNGTVVVNGATRVCIQVEPGRSAQLNPGDELKLGESTTYAILFGALWPADRDVLFLPASGDTPWRSRVGRPGMEGPSRPLAVTRGKPLPPTYICRNMAWRRGTISPHADFRCGRFPSPGRAREHPACGLCGARSCARRVAGPVERVQPSSPRHAFSPCHVPAAQSACRMIGSNSENPITPTSRQSPGPVYLYERRGVYGA